MTHGHGVAIAATIVDGVSYIALCIALGEM